MAQKYEAMRPINHKGKHYRPGDTITGFTGWWRYWKFLKWGDVRLFEDAAAPTIDSITRGSTMLTVNFTQGDDGGSPFTGYQYQLDTDPWADFDPQITDSPGVITSLTNGTTYSVKIRAVNAEMADGAASDAVLATPATTPAAPTLLVATPTDTTASIAFTPSSDGGDDVTDFQYKIGTGAWTSTDPVSIASPVLIPDLVTDTEYSVKIRAVNTVGNGLESAAVVFTTDTLPAAPTDLVATVGNESVSIAFTPGADGGSTITAYQYTLNDGTDWYGTTPATTDTPMLLTMPNDVEYTVKIRAVTLVGNSPASAAVVFTPVDQVPGAPTALVATPAALAVSIAFTAPSMNGGTLVEYQHSFNDGVDWAGTTPDTVASPYDMTMPAADYTVVLRAVNSAGNGPKSDPVTFTVPAA